jgi:hypothetical protein
MAPRPRKPYRRTWSRRPLPGALVGTGHGALAGTSKALSPGTRTTVATGPPPARLGRRATAGGGDRRQLPDLPIPEIARLGKTVKRWKQAFLAYFDTAGASNGGTEAVNGLIELHRPDRTRFTNRDNHRLRMRLIGGELDKINPKTHRKYEEPPHHDGHAL